MRRKNGSVGTRPGRDGLWLRWWDPDGRRRLKRAQSDDLDDATDELRDLLADDEQARKRVAPTLDAFLADTYVPIYKEEVAASTFTRSKPQLDRLSRKLGSRRITEINPGDIREFVARLRAKGLSPGTLQREVAVIRPVFEAAIESGYIVVNPVRVKLEASKPRRPPLIPSEEIDKLIASTSDLYRGYLILLIDTGLRRTTCLELLWSDVAPDFSALLRNPKANAKRKIPAVPLTRRARALLKEIRAAQPDSETRVFPHLTQNAVRLWWNRVRTRKDCPEWLKTWRLHDWRHQFGSELAQRRVPFPVVADLLGHVNARLVAEVYGTSAPSDAAADAIRVLERSRRPARPRAARRGTGRTSPSGNTHRAQRSGPEARPS